MIDEKILEGILNPESYSLKSYATVEVDHDAMSWRYFDDNGCLIGGGGIASDGGGGGVGGGVSRTYYYGGFGQCGGGVRYPGGVSVRLYNNPNATSSDAVTPDTEGE